MNVTTTGYVDPGFKRAAEAFRANCANGVECGASLCVYADGRRVIDVAGGYRDLARTKPWLPSTKVNVYSTTKGIISLLLAVLIDKNMLDPDEPVSTYWPEFGAEDKHRITVRLLASHQAGLHAFARRVALEDLYNWPECVKQLERQSAAWEPGTRTAYQARTFGFLIGELIQRATGYTIADALSHYVVRPAGGDFTLGMDGDDVADIVPAPPPPGVGPAVDVRLATVLGPQTMSGGRYFTDDQQETMRAVFTNPVIPPEAANTPAWRRAVLPSSNGHSNARSIAALYDYHCRSGHYKALSPSVLRDVTEVQTARVDLSLSFPVRYGIGFTLNGSEFGPHGSAFGHRGIGGSIGFYDPMAHLAVGYAMNYWVPRVGDWPGNDLRVDGILNALYADRS